MFGIASKKTVNKLRSQINDLQKKSFTPQMLFLNDGDIPLFNFSKKDDIKKAIQNVPELASAINYIGKSFSSGKYQILSNGKVLENHKLLQLLENPHPLYNNSEFKQTLAENLYSFGVAYIYMNKPGVEVKGMFILPSNTVSPYVGDLTHKELREATDKKDVIKHYEISVNGKKINIDVDNIIVIKLNTVITVNDKYMNFESPLKPLEHALKVTPAMYNSMQNLMNNGGMKGFISNKSTDSGSFIPIDKEDKKNIQRAFRNYGSKNGQYDIAFTSQDLNYIPISSRIKDMLLPEQQKMIKNIIFDILGVDTALLNSEDGKKYDNYGISRKSFYTETIIPGANNYTDALTSYFGKEVINLDYTYLDVFSEDEKTKVEKTNIESLYIIQLNKSVALNEMSRQNAVELLIINGYDIKTAEKLIG